MEKWPSNHAGEFTCTLLAPKTIRKHCCITSETPQVASSDFQRPSIKKANDGALKNPTCQGRHDKAQWQRKKKIAFVKFPGRVQSGKMQPETERLPKNSEWQNDGESEAGAEDILLSHSMYRPPTAIISPCAMLMMPSQRMEWANPSATTRRIEPRLRPRKNRAKKVDP